MKYKIGILSIAMAAIVLVSMGAVASAAQPATTSVSGAPSMVYAGGIQYTFIRGANGDLYWKTGTGAWKDVGIAITSAPAAVVQDGHITVLFAVGTTLASTNLGLFNIWSAPITWPGTVAAGTSPAAVIGSDDNIWAFYVDSTSLNLMVDQSATTPLGSPTAVANLGGVVTATPAVTSPVAGWVDVVVRGTGGNIWEKTFVTGEWSPNWTEFHDGTIGYGAALVSTGGADVALFVSGSNYRMYELTSSNNGLTWNVPHPLLQPGVLGWVDLGGAVASQPAAVQHSSTTLVEVLGGGGIWVWTSPPSLWNPIVSPIVTP